MRIGDGPLEVQTFIASKNLQRSKQETSSLRGNESLKSVTYIKEQSYTNNKSGVEKITAILQFTPLFPTSQGVVSLVYGIHYETEFGEGIKPQVVFDDLIQRFGKPTVQSGNWFLAWRFPKEPQYDLEVEAFIQPPSSSGKPGELRLNIVDSHLLAESYRCARAHIDATDSNRQKDNTKPSY